MAKDKTEKKKKFRMPNTYIIIFCVVVFAVILTYIVPMGKFDIKEQYVWDPKHEELREQEVLDSNTFELIRDADGDPQRSGVPLFGAYHGVGLFNYVFEGIVSAVSIVVFILVIGGAFGIILKTGAVETGMMSIIKRLQGKEVALIPILFVIFSLGGATFGMGEEAIPFAMIVVPLVVAMGYDAVTGVLITYGATQIGFAASWMNPFNVAIAQGIAGIPVLSGMGFRIFVFIFFTVLGAVFTMLYARRIKKNPEKSVSFESDAYFRDDFKHTEEMKTKFGIGHALVLLVILAGMIWVGVGVISHDFYISEIATQFFIMGLVAGVIGIVFKLNGMRLNDMATSFKDGAKDLLGAALVVGMAKGIIIILAMGGDPTDPTHPNVLNTILYYVGNGLQQLPSALASWFMYLFQSVFNFFVSSGSGQAALTMPLMAPLSQYAGISRQTAVLAFQLGDGFTNLIVPTSGALMGVLAVARIDWARWVKIQIKFQAILFVLASVFIIFATLASGLLGQEWQEVTASTIEEGQQTEVGMDEGAMGKFNIYELGKGETKWIKLKVEQGKSYEIYLVDSYNNKYHEKVPADEVVKAIWCQLYEKDKATQYGEGVYTVFESSGAVTPEGVDPAISFTAEQDEINLKLEGYKPEYIGKFAIKIEETYFIDMDDAGEFTPFMLGKGESKWVRIPVAEGAEYELYLIDDTNINFYEGLIAQDEVIKSVMFNVYDADKTSPYPRGIYTQRDEDLDGGVVPEAFEVETAPASAKFTAKGRYIYVNLQTRRAEYSGKTVIKLVGYIDEEDLTMEKEIDAGIGEKIMVYDMSAGETIWVKVPVESGKTYEATLIDSYNNDFHQKPLSNIVNSLWFAVYNADKSESYPEDVYTEPKYSNARKVAGGYTKESADSSAIFTAKDDFVYFLVEGSKATYSGNFGFKIVALE